MPRWSFLVSLVVLVGLIAAGPALLTFAQSTPSATAGMMSVEETRTAIQAYLDALGSRGDFGQYLADDVVLAVMDTGQEVHGKQAVIDTIVALHEQIFNARPELTRLVVDHGMAAAELVFAGTQVGEFAGIASTGRSVRVPYVASYDLISGKITAIRLFGFASGLVMQLSAPGTPTAATPTS